MTTSSPRPTYQNALRAIGRYLDRHVYRHVLVSEVADGFVARVFPGLEGDLKAEGMALPMSDVLAMLASQEQARGVPTGDVKMPPLCPTGYEDFFRSLGYDLDAVDASNVSLVEMSGGILVLYTAGWVGGRRAGADVLRPAAHRRAAGQGLPAARQDRSHRLTPPSAHPRIADRVTGALAHLRAWAGLLGLDTRGSSE